MWCLGGHRSASTSRASSVSAEPPPRSSGRGQRSGLETSVTYNRRPAKTAAAVAAAAGSSVSFNSDEAAENGSATRSTGDRGRGSRETRKSRPVAVSSTPLVETVKRKISSEWDDCTCLFHLRGCVIYRTADHQYAKKKSRIIG